MRWLAIILALVLAGCGEAAAEGPTGKMAFAREGETARLTYRLKGKIRYAMTCDEGRDHAAVYLYPTPSDGQVVKLGSGREDNMVELSQRALSEAPFWFHVNDSFLRRFLAIGEMTVNGEPLEIAPAGEREALWRFYATCTSVPADRAARGEPAPRSLYDLMSSLKVEDAAADARRAMARGDARLATVVSSGRAAPGAPGDQVPAGLAYRDIDPTSDMIGSDEHGALKDRAARYAAVYNAVVLSGAK
jgi:hypothetical protein